MVVNLPAKWSAQVLRIVSDSIQISCFPLIHSVQGGSDLVLVQLYGVVLPVWSRMGVGLAVLSKQAKNWFRVSGRTLFVGFVSVAVLVASECLYPLPHASGVTALKVLLYVLGLSDAPPQCPLI